MKIFLKAKHWQLFLLTFGVPMIFYIFMMYSIFSTLSATIASNGMSDAAMMDIMIGYMRLVPFMVILFMGVLYGWYWSVGIGLQSKKPDNVHMNVVLFKVFLVIPIIYIFSFMMLLSFFIRGFSNNQMDDMINFAPFFPLIVPLHLFSMFCMFYCMYFVAKTIKTVELQREANFGDFVGEFFLIWFYPIGVWILQPKINKLADGTFGHGPYSGSEGSTILDERMTS